MSPDAQILRLDNVTLGYPGRGDVFRDLSAELRPGELVSLLGANGSGKSTLLKALSGELTPSAGNIVINGKNLFSLSATERARLVSIVTTGKVSVGGLTVYELVAMGRYPHTGLLGHHSRTDRRVIFEAIDAVGLARLADRMTATLSDGERQKAMIARALAQNTPVMLLDEPTAFLDAASRVETLSLLRDLAATSSKAILLSTHDIATAIRLSSRLWLVKSDGVRPSELISGLPDKLAADPAGLPSLFPGRHVRYSQTAADYLPV